MSNTVHLIGVEVDELCWLRMLILLLRHPDPAVPELARQALLYLTDAAGKGDSSQSGPVHQLG